MSALEKIIGASEDGTQQRQTVDYKMVTFTLGGNDYGIDIMNVKEIYKTEHLTPVPNTAPFVRGVFNLRGEIISVIDLRRMFSLPVIDLASGGGEDVIFVTVDDHLVGVVVDFINDVVGIDSATIQPPHPLFGDINIKYISGVVEHDDRLFVILDTDAIFGLEGTSFSAVPEIVQEVQTPISETSAPLDMPEESLGYTFVTETLLTFNSFVVSDVNEDWVRARFEEWKQLKGNDSAALQLGSLEDASEFLGDFGSADTGAFWTDAAAEALRQILPVTDGHLVSAWDVGCGQGHEAFTIAATLRKRFPDKQIKVWAHDSDLLKVSNAPNMVFSESALPAWIREFAQEGSKGWLFKKDINDAILFEYHDVLHENRLPPVNLIFARDILSFLSAEGRAKVLSDFHEKLVSGGILIIGDNERIRIGGWEEHEVSGIRWYTSTD